MAVLLLSPSLLCNAKKAERRRRIVLRVIVIVINLLSSHFFACHNWTEGKEAVRFETVIIMNLQTGK